MVEYIICCHGKMASGLVSSVEMILGQEKNIYAIDFEKGISLQTLEESLNKLVMSLIDDDNVKEKNHRIVFLTDLAGATPFNTCYYLIEKFKANHDNVSFHLVSGVNLPMILEALLNPVGEKDIDLVKKIKESAKKSIVSVEEILS